MDQRDSDVRALANLAVRLGTVRLCEAAPLLGVTPATVRRWCDTGQLKAVRKWNRERRVCVEDLARKLEEKEWTG